MKFLVNVFIEVKDIVIVFIVLFFLENVFCYLLFEVLCELLDVEKLVDENNNIKICK